MPVETVAAIFGLPTICYLVMLLAQAYLNFTPPRATDAERAIRYPRLRRFSVRNNRILGILYFICSVSGLFIFALSGSIISTLVAGFLVLIATLTLSIRASWKFI